MPTPPESTLASAAREAALTPDQQAELARHLPLVALQIKRQPGVGPRGRIDRDRDDLFQEGCIALARAIRAYQPQRHGEFAPYALARIHNAFSMMLYEQIGAIRVPAAVQRSDRARGITDRHSPGDRPRIIRRDLNEFSPRRPSARHDPARTNTVALRHLARDRYETVARRIAAELPNKSRAQDDAPSLVETCLQERWLIAEASARTPLREIARRYQCSLGRVTFYDQRFHGSLAAALREDEPTQWLSKHVSENKVGLEGDIDEDDVNEFVALTAANDGDQESSDRRTLTPTLSLEGRGS